MEVSYLQELGDGLHPILAGKEIHCRLWHANDKERWATRRHCYLKTPGPKDKVEWQCKFCSLAIIGMAAASIPAITDVAIGCAVAPAALVTTKRFSSFAVSSNGRTNGKSTPTQDI